jgi:hypothetical protein
MSSSTPQPEAGSTTTAPQDIPQSQQAKDRTADDAPNPTPVEMSNLEASSSAQQRPSLDKPAGPARTDTTTALEQSTHPPPFAPPPIPETAAVPVSRTFSTAIGPSSDSPVVPSKDEEATGPTLLITLLLTSGARHPFKLDSKYLNKRHVTVLDNDPFNLSVYKLKELILREWREEWESKPASPSSIRLISFGKLLDDKAPLKGEWSTYSVSCDSTDQYSRCPVKRRCAQCAPYDHQAPRLY